MMTSSPPYLLLEANTIAAIQRLWAFRKASGHPVYFTLDAGPNLHLLYPDTVADAVKVFVRTEMLPLCEGNHYIADRVGSGPIQLEPSTDV
jgi:diphosphomevalonate decarboxylase